jgi:hypothetical protein
MHGGGPNMLRESVERFGEGLSAHVYNDCGTWTGGSFGHNYVRGVVDGSMDHGEAIQLQASNSGGMVHHDIFRDQPTKEDVVAARRT